MGAYQLLSVISDPAQTALTWRPQRHPRRSSDLWSSPINGCFELLSAGVVLASRVLFTRLTRKESMPVRLALTMGFQFLSAPTSLFWLWGKCLTTIGFLVGAAGLEPATR